MRVKRACDDKEPLSRGAILKDLHSQGIGIDKQAHVISCELENCLWNEGVLKNC